MRVTARESHAARALAEAFLEFAIAREEAAAARQPTVSPENIRIKFDPPPPVSEAPREAKRPAQTKLPDKLLVDANEAARLLSLGERSMWTLTAPRGPIPAVRVGRAVRYSVSSLEEFVRRTEVKRR